MGRRNRGSRHRSHKHKQQKADSADSDTEYNLRHGPNPDPSPSSPWAMESLPPYVEGPSVLKQSDMESVKGQQEAQKGSPVAALNLRREVLITISDTSAMPAMESGDGRAPDPSCLDRKLIAPGNAVNMKEDGAVKAGKGKDTDRRAGRSLEHTDGIPYSGFKHAKSTVNITRELETDSSNNSSLPEFVEATDVHSNAAEFVKLRASESLSKQKEVELDNSSCHLNTFGMEPEKKRAWKNDSLHKPSESEGALVQGNVQYSELEKEPETQFCGRKKGFRDGERWRDNSEGPCFEEQNQNEIGHKIERLRQEKPERDNSSSRLNAECWKTGRHLNVKHKAESLKADNGQENLQKDWDRKRKFNRSREEVVKGELRDSRQKDTVCRKYELKDNTCKEDLRKGVKERDVKESEELCKENRSRGNRYKDEKGKELRLAYRGDFIEQERSTSDDYSVWHREDKTLIKPYQDDKLKQRRENVKDGRWKLKGRSNRVDLGEEEILIYQKEKIDEHNKEGLDQAKSKYEKKKGEKEQVSYNKQKEERDMDRAAGAHGKYEIKRSEKQNNFKIRSNIKTQHAKRIFVKQLDGNDMDELEKHGKQRISPEGKVKRVETASKYEKVQNISNTDGKFRDDWIVGEVDLKERCRGMDNRCSKHRNESKERLCGDGHQLKKGSSDKESIGAQKRSSDEDYWERNGLILKKPRDRLRKHAGEFTEEQEPAVTDNFIFLKDASKNTREKDGRPIDGYGDQVLKQGKILDRQSKRKWSRDLAEAKERKGHLLNEADGASLKASAATSLQNQVKEPSITEAMNLSTARSQSRGSQVFDTLDTPIAESDHTRPRGRLTGELVDIFQVEKTSHEKFGRTDKFETSVSMSSSSGNRWSREQNWLMTDISDQGKYYIGCEEEVRSWEPRSSTQDSVDERRHSLPHVRRWDDGISSRGPVGHGNEELMRGSSLTLLNATVLKRKHPNVTQGMESTKTRRMDGGSVERLKPRHKGSQMSQRPRDGSSARQRPPNCLSAHSSLPPPPPYRLGVDNPGVIGLPTIFPDGSNSKENGRPNKKVRRAHSRRPELVGPGDSWGGFGMGRWNSHNQIRAPGPGPIFHPFPQMGSEGFLGISQQFHMPHMLGPHGTRLSADMEFEGARFHMGDGVIGFPGHGLNSGPVMGWPRFSDGNETHGPLSGHVDTWERPGQYADDRSRFGHVDWGLYSRGMSGGGWEDALKPWQGQEGDASLTVTHLHKESLCQVRIEEVASHPDPHMETVEAVQDGVPDTVEISLAHPILKAVSRANKRFTRRMQTMLLHAEVSAELSGVKLYHAYLNLLPPSEAKQREAGTEDHLIVSDAFIDEDLEYEVDLEAEDLLLDTDPLQMFLPSFSNSSHKDALRIFQQRPVQQDRVQKSVVGSFLLPQSSLMI